MGFRRGDLVVYPRYGVGKVVNAEERPVFGRRQRCLEIRFEADNRTVYVQEADFQKVHLRLVMPSKVVTHVYQVLKEPSRYGRINPARERLSTYTRKASIGDPMSLAEVARDLNRRGKRHRLSETEQELASRSVELLTEELAVVEKRAEAKVRKKIEKLLGV